MDTPAHPRINDDESETTMTVGGGFGAPGPVFNPNLVPTADDEKVSVTTEDETVDASADELAEHGSVTAHLDDPEVAEAIEHLRPTKD